MNLFELATLLSPAGGAIGGAMAVTRFVPVSPMWMWLAIPVGLACGLGCYLGLMALVVGKHDKDPDLPGWRMVVILVVPGVSPFVAALLTFNLVRAILYVAA